MNNIKQFLLGFAILMACVASTANAMLPDLYSEAMSPNKDRAATSLAPNEVIDTFSGGLGIVHTDLVVPGDGGMDIRIQRAYSSNNVYASSYGQLSQSVGRLVETSPYGLGWTMHFGRIRLPTALLSSGWSSFRSCAPNSKVTDNPTLEMPDGSQHQLICNDFPSTYSTNAHFVTKNNWVVEPIISSSGVISFRVIDNNGMKYTMDYELEGGRGTEFGDTVEAVWYTTQIEDRNGNKIFIEYDNASERESPIYKRVYANDGRSVTFVYSNKNNPNLAQLSSIKYGNKTLTYTFNRLIPDYTVLGGRQFRLLRSVKLPGPSSTGKWDYTYHQKTLGLAGDNMLRTITYPYGAITEYDYDYQCFIYVSCAAYQRHTVVKSKVNKGRGIATGSWSFAYSDSVNQDFNITKITGPTTIEEYKHYRVNVRVDFSAPLPANTQKELWRIGLLDTKTIKSRAGALLQTENYQYGNRVISNEVYERYPYTFDNVRLKDDKTRLHYLTERSIIRDGKTYTTKYENFTDNINPHKITEIGQETKVTNLTYYPRVNGQNIVGQVKNEVISNTANRRILRTFDSKGRLSTENNYGVLTSYTYDANGNLSTHKDARNKTTSFKSYYRGIARTEERPESVTIKRTVDTYGNITRQIDGNNHTTNYTYDELNRLKSIDYPRGSDASIVWTTSQRTLTRGAYVQVINFDGLGRTTCTKSENVHVGQGYDSVGNQTYKTYPSYSSCAASTRTKFTYDPLNRPKRTTHPDNSYREITYLSNNRQRLRDERGKLFTNSYRSFSDPDTQEMIGITGPESLDFDVDLNILGQANSIKRNGVTRAFNYGSTVFLKTETNPETGTTTYGRDALGNMTSKKVGASPTTAYIYDDLNRLERMNYPGSTPDIAMTYDRNSNLKTVNSGIANFTYTYDENNNLEKEQQTIAGKKYFLNFTYNGLDHLASMTYPDNGEVTYAPNGLGWPTKAAPYVNNVVYNAAGQPTSIAYRNGRTTTHSYWQRLWPRRTIVNGGISDREHAFDVAGNKTSVNDRLNNTYDLNMTYDGLSRVKTANGAWGSGSINYSTDDDITAKVMGTNRLNYTYSTSNRISSVSGIKNFITPAQYTYDAYGNITKKANGSVGWTYQYDDASNLRKVFDKAGTQLRSYDYSGQKQRVRSIKSGETRIHLVGKDGQLYSEFVTSGAKPNIANVYLGNRLVAELESAVNGAPSSSVFGWGFGNSANKYNYSRSFTLDKIPNKFEYCVDGYGINANTEVSVTLNGSFIGYMNAGANPKETCFDVNPSLLRVGSNTVLFTQTNPVQTWGVGGFRENALFAGASMPPVIMLLLDEEQ